MITSSPAILSATPKVLKYRSGLGACGGRRSEISARASKQSAETARRSSDDARRAQLTATLAVAVTLVGVAVQALTYVGCDKTP